MIEFKHPSQLNPYQIYQQASRIAQKTSRAKNPDWYVIPVEIQRQWHLWIGEGEVVSAVFDKKAGRWIDGPDVSWLLGDDGDIEEVESGRERGEAINAALADVLRSRELGGKVKSLGVVWHVADEFAVLDLSRDYSGIVDFEEVQNSLQADPQLVLGDASSDPLTHSWKLMPYWGVLDGGRRSVVIQTLRTPEEFLSVVRNYGEEQNIAIVTMAASAPLETMALIPLCLEEEDLQRGSIVVLQYRGFSALVGLDSQGELILLRSVQHRDGVEHVSNLGEVLLNTKALLGMDEPVVHIFPMVKGSGVESLTAELTRFFIGKEPMDIGFIELDQLKVVEGIPASRIELLFGDSAAVGEGLKKTALSQNVSFSNLHEGGWALQDFAPLPLEVQEVYPSWRDLQLRKWFGMVKVVLLLACVGGIVWGGITYKAATSTPAWSLTEEDSLAVTTQSAKLNKNKEEIDYWEKIMRTRSEGWSNMELLLKLFPQDKGVVITSCKYTIGNLVLGGGKSKEVGVERRWDFQGYAKPAAISYLNDLGTTKVVKQFFNEFAEDTEAEEFDMTKPTRTLNANLQRKQGTYPVSGALSTAEAAKYTIAFDMNITQIFNTGDDLTIPKKK